MATLPGTPAVPEPSQTGSYLSESSTTLLGTSSFSVDASESEDS